MGKAGCVCRDLTSVTRLGGFHGSKKAGICLDQADAGHQIQRLMSEMAGLVMKFRGSREGYSNKSTVASNSNHHKYQNSSISGSIMGMPLLSSGL